MRTWFQTFNTPCFLYILSMLLYTPFIGWIVDKRKNTLILKATNITWLRILQYKPIRIMAEK
jgi:hypothetical protein